MWDTSPKWIDFWVGELNYTFIAPAFVPVQWCSICSFLPHTVSSPNTFFLCVGAQGLPYGLCVVDRKKQQGEEESHMSVYQEL